MTLTGEQRDTIKALAVRQEHDALCDYVETLLSQTQKEEDDGKADVPGKKKSAK